MNKLKSPLHWRHVTMFEYYSKEGTKVYRYWKLENELEYRKQLTPYNELPYEDLSISKDS